MDAALLNHILTAWTEGETEPVDETTFTKHATPGFHAWNAWSPEVEWANLAASLIDSINPNLIIETGVGQGYVTRRLFANRHGAHLYCYEADKQLRDRLAELDFFKHPDVALPDATSPTSDTFTGADLVILDSHWGHRHNELRTWWRYGKPGSVVLIHDTGNGHHPHSEYARLHNAIETLGIPGVFLPNPRGSFIGAKPATGFEFEYTKLAPAVEPNSDIAQSDDNSTTVCVSWLYRKNVRGEMAASVLHAALHTPYLFNSTVIRQSGPMLHMGRNRVADDFLTKTDSEWLWMIDSDMQFDHTAIQRLLEVADPVTCPIIGGLCFNIGADGYIFPTVYRYGTVAGDFEFIRADAIPENALIEVDATGTAFLLVHRSVFEAIAKQHDEPFRWFNYTEINGRAVGEDIEFCMRAKAAGFPIYVHTGVEINHIKDRNIDFTAHKDWKRDNRYVIAGVPRSATKYAATLLSNLGVLCGHEQVFTYNTELTPFVDIPWRGWRGESSWLAVPHLERLHYERVTILHQIRNPFDVIRSMLVTGLFHSNPPGATIYYQDYIRQHAPHIFDSDIPLERAVRFYIDWNRYCDRFADRSWRVEDLNIPTVTSILATLGTKRSTEQIETTLTKTPHVNESNHEFRTLTLDDIPAGTLKDEFVDMVGRYGYLEGE